MSKKRQKGTNRDEIDTSMDTYSLALRFRDQVLGTSKTPKQNREGLITISHPFKSKLLAEDREEVYIEEGDYSLKAKELINDIVARPDKFIDLVIQDPSLILNDYVIKSAILRYQKDILLGDQKNSQKARASLEKAKIGVFIPANAPKKRRKNFMLNLLSAASGYQ